MIVIVKIKGRSAERSNLTIKIIEHPDDREISLISSFVEF